MRHVLDAFFPQRGPKGLRFWGRSLPLSPRLQELLLALDRPQGSDVEVLKHSLRRSVFRVRHAVPGLPSLIVKGFPLEKIESRVKYRKFGLAEFSHYQQAAERNVPAPACHGYFEITFLGLVKANGVIVEDLAGWRSLGQLLQAAAAPQRAILAKAIPLMSRLYETGANHVDISLNNLLESPDGTELRLIDWQYCSFVAPRQPSQLLLQASHFLNEAGVAAGSPDADWWLEQLRQATHCPIGPETFQRAAAALQARKKIAAPERLALMLDPATEQLLAR
jgi:hypothetical protein